MIKRAGKLGDGDSEATQAGRIPNDERWPRRCAADPGNRLPRQHRLERGGVRRLDFEQEAAEG
ncbi:MAG: hypothetical protein KIS63_21505, partial [Caldilineales bacterium]|nr:hypothetical protein [Caldilineales bacterium]